MAIDCTVFFDDPGTTIRLLDPNVPYTGTIANAFTGAFFNFNLDDNQTVSFELSITANTPANINVVFTLYRRNLDGSYTNLGSSLSTDSFNTFSYIGAQENYFVCITTDFSVSYELVALYSQFNPIAKISADCYHGHNSSFEFAKKVSVCDSDVFYTLLDGRLPPGVTLASSGIISGIPDELDCTIESMEQNLEPSFELYENTEVTEYVSPKSVDFTILVRAALVDDPGTFEDREFKICVVNNWDRDADHFLKLKDDWEQPRIALDGQETWRPIESISNEETTPSLHTDCPVCEIEEQEEQQITEEELKSICDKIEVLPEFEENELVDINKDEIDCFKDCNEEIKTSTNLEPKLESSCPVVEVVEKSVNILQDLPETLCKSKVDEVQNQEKIINKPVEDIPILCVNSIISDMKTKKVCIERPTCEEYIIVETPIKEEPIILEGLCDASCNTK